MTETVISSFIKIFKFNNTQLLLFVPMCGHLFCIYTKNQMPNLQSFNYGFVALLAWKCIKV